MNVLRSPEFYLLFYITNILVLNGYFIYIVYLLFTKKDVKVLFFEWYNVLIFDLLCIIYIYKIIRLRIIKKEYYYKIWVDALIDEGINKKPLIYKDILLFSISMNISSILFTNIRSIMSSIYGINEVNLYSPLYKNAFSVCSSLACTVVYLSLYILIEFLDIRRLLKKNNHIETNKNNINMTSLQEKSNTAEDEIC
jgi:hypothetical protein